MALASIQAANLLTLAETYSDHEFRTLEALSGLVRGKGGFFSALKRGGDCLTATAEQALGWFDRNWPVDLAWPSTVARPSGAMQQQEAGPKLPEETGAFLAALAHLPIWTNGRRPSWWHDVEVRDFIVQSHRQMSILRCQKKGAARFGDRFPKKSSVHDFWVRLDHVKTDPRMMNHPAFPRPTTSKKEAA